MEIFHPTAITVYGNSRENVYVFEREHIKSAHQKCLLDQNACQKNIYHLKKKFSHSIRRFETCSKGFFILKKFDIFKRWYVGFIYIFLKCFGQAPKLRAFVLFCY